MFRGFCAVGLKRPRVILQFTGIFSEGTLPQAPKRNLPFHTTGRRQAIQRQRVATIIHNKTLRLRLGSLIRRQFHPDNAPNLPIA